MLAPSGSLDRFKRAIERRILFGNELTPELAAILLVYFVQGILGLSRLAVSFFLKDDLGLTPAQVSALMGIAAIPWMVKPLIGFVSDGAPIVGYRRRPYLVLSGLLGTAAWIFLAAAVSNAWQATIAIALTSLSVAISDVIADSIVVERARNASQSQLGSLQSLCWGTSALGGLITAYLSGVLLEQFSTYVVFGITATFPLVVAAVAGLIDETPVDRGINFKAVTRQVEQLKNAILMPSILLPTIFIFLWQATPTAESAFFFFVTNDLGFEPEFLGRVQLVTSVAALLGVLLFQRFFKSVPFRRIFLWTTILSSALGMSMLLLVTHANRTIGIDDRWFSLGDSLILTVMGQIAFMPVLVLAARLCPEGIEATLFALLMSVANTAGIVSRELGAVLMHWMNITSTNFDNLWLLVVVTNLSTLLPLPFLQWLPESHAQEQHESAELVPSQLSPVPEPEPTVGAGLGN